MRNYPKLFTRTVARVVSTVLVATTTHVFADPSTYLYALEMQRAKEAKVREIAKKMNVDPEFLLHPEGRRSFDFASLFDAVTRTLGLKSESVTDAPQSVKDQIAQVKQRYALVAADTTMAKIAEVLSAPAKNKGQMKAELQSVLRLIDKDFLPPLASGVPGVAASRDAQMRAQMNQFRQNVKAIINAPHALDEQNIDATLAQLRTVSSGQLHVRGNGNARWAKDPFPVKDSYKQAPKQSVGNRYGADSVTATKDATTPAIVANAAPLPANLKPMTTAVSTEITALAQQLGTPAKAFAYVYDNVDWETYGGVVKGPLGALHERAGNDWDQALLLRDLLTAQGYQAQIEWGKVSLPIARAMNLAGTEDPLQAANLLATGGLDSVALTQNGSPIFVQFTHAWVRAYIPYVPNRGTTNGTPDTWVRMDPSFKKYDYQPGIDVNVSWNEDNYLQTSAIRPPVDHYADQVWGYIRANNLNCNNLAQVPKTGAIHKANFPFVPATLNAKIEQLKGLSVNPPASQMQTVTLSVSDPMWGDVLTTYSANLADLYGKKLTLTFQPATADDAATIARYGGLYNTPAYIVHLKAVFAVDDVTVAEGGSVAAGGDLSLDLSFREPVLGTDNTHHEIVAGEAMTEVIDGGRASDALIAQRMERLKQMSATAPANDQQRDALITEKLHIAGLRYMQEVDDTFTFSTGVRWHRWVKSAFEGCVRQTLQASYNFVGTAVRVTPADHNIDVTRVVVGIIPITNDMSERLNAMALAGLNSSYLEGAIWEETEAQQGISATKALLLARMAGQRIWTADRSNVEAVLNSINLSAEAENNIRGAVSQGRVAIVPSANIRLNKWVGTGYILRDPINGSAVYPIAGGFAGGSSTGSGTGGTDDTLGIEEWLENGPWGELIRYLTDSFRAVGGSDPAPSSTQGDPVNAATGNMYRFVSDINVTSPGIPVSLGRTYNSRSNYNGVYGYGWTSNYEEAVAVNGDGSVTYREGDGTEHRFSKNTDGTFNSPAGKHLTLTASGNGYVIRLLEGPEMVFDASGRITAQRDTNGNVVTINRDAAGMPVSIVDAAGRTALTFTTANGKVTQVTDLIGRTVVYTYAGDDLVSVTDTAGKTSQYTYDLSHNMTAVIDPVGNTQSFDYDTDDRMFHHVDANGNEEYVHYDIAGRQSVVTDRNGGDRLIEYDTHGRALSEADAAGNMVKATFDAANNRTAVIDSRGNVSTYEYDADGNMTKSTAPDGAVTTATYTATGRVLSETNEVGLTTSYSYDARGNITQVSRVVNGVSEATSNTYDARGNILTTTDANGGVTRMTWGDNGVPLSQTDPSGATVTYGTDAAGRITSMKDGNNNETKLTYDGHDRVTSVVDVYGNTTTFTYDDAGRRTSVTAPNGITRFTYDGEGRLLAATDALGNKSSRTYDGEGRVVGMTDAKGNTIRYEYDAVGRVVRSIAANGDVWSFDYCAGVGSGGCAACGGSGGSDGNFCVLRDPTGAIVKQEFDTMGRVTKVIDPFGRASYAQYDKAGRKTLLTDAAGNTTRYGYDEAGHLLTVTDAAGGVTTYMYDKNGLRTAQKDANGNITTYKNDALGRVIEMTDPLLRKTSYTYDGLGNLKSLTDANGKTTQYAYNIRRLTTVTYDDGTTDNYSYDALGRQTGMTNANVSLAWTYDTLNRVKTITNQTYNLTVAYDYDAAGNWTKMTTPQSTVQYAYDAKNRLTSIADSMFGTFRFSYDANDRRTELQYPNGLKASYQYDVNSELTAIVTKDSIGTVIDAWSYQYDPAGNRTAKTDMDGKSETYQFDNLYRLSSATYTTGKSEKFTYDAVGNRKTRTDETGAATVYSYDVANQLLRAGSDTFTYDNNGNQKTRVSSRGTTTMVYDLANRVTGISGPDGTETNLYAPNGQRVDMAGTAIENGRVRVLYDISGHPILDWGTDNRTWTYRLYGPRMDEALAEYRRTNNRTTYLHHDGIGSVTAVTSTTGTPLYRSTYDANGNMTRTSDGSGIPPTRLGYTGRELSVGSLMNFRARYYDSSVGRFTSSDPYPADDANPMSLNRYAYAQNNPTTFNDPLGLYCANPATGNKPMWGIGVNRAKPSVDAMDWSSPGVCIYLGAVAINPYLDLGPATPYPLPGLGTGTLLTPHINIKTYAFGVFRGGAGYPKTSISNLHIGIWVSQTHVCFIIDDPTSGTVTPVHFRLCIPKWLLYAIAIIIACVLLYFLLLVLLEALAAWGGWAVLEWILGGGLAGGWAWAN